MVHLSANRHPRHLSRHLAHLSTTSNNTMPHKLETPNIYAVWTLVAFAFNHSQFTSAHLLENAFVILSELQCFFDMHIVNQTEFIFSWLSWFCTDCLVALSVELYAGPALSMLLVVCCVQPHAVTVATDDDAQQQSAADAGPSVKHKSTNNRLLRHRHHSQQQQRLHNDNWVWAFC